MTTSAIRYWPLEILLRLSLRRGPVLRSRLGADRYAYLLGPQANALILAHDEWFSVGEAFAGLVPVDGPTSVVVSDGPDHTRRRALIRPALSPRSVDGYLEVIAHTAAEAVAELRPGHSVDAYALFRRAIRRSTLRSLFGPTMAADADWLGETLQPLLDLVDRLPQLVTWQARLRTPAWRRAMAARDRLDAYVYRQIAEARRGAGDVESVLHALVAGRDGTGSGLSDLEVRDQAVTLIAAGYETTSAALGWAVYALATHPQWQARARAEVRELLGDRAPTPADLRALPTVAAVISETLRLYPPAAMSARRAERDFSFADRLVRTGDLVIFSPYVTHRDPRVFEAPERFDPQRWLAGGHRPPPEYLPFGGGAHRCAGSHLATVELTVMLAHLLRTGPFELSGRPPRARSFAAMRPQGGVLITVRPTDGVDQ
ncbi:cytochrome P450 [Granulicoccus phenolivorans]|uniref:cytochrome P450 n=1 Tax=Granulicoccus phenolivorans TaxID=266854 RepID=UPI000415FE84|nr:cytochrome P450 [Granulicoccus phenolivorans]